MAVAVGVLFAFATMLCWGAADFFAKKAVDNVGYKLALLINQIVALAPICVFAFLSSPLPNLSISMVLLIIITGALSLLGFFYLYKGLNKGAL
ncbi:MAG: EamA family transporter, partial [Crenarchaeota archaeon]|nr:EamA family transporter [Thermoproteota archaeon]